MLLIQHMQDKALMKISLIFFILNLPDPIDVVTCQIHSEIAEKLNITVELLHEVLYNNFTFI